MKKQTQNSISFPFSLFVMVLVMLFLSFNTYSVKAQVKLSLSDALSRGLKNNYQIQISKQNIEIAKNNNTWGTVGRYPKLSIGLSQTNMFDNSPSTVNPGERSELLRNSISPNINMNWMLFNGFAANISKQKLAKYQELSEGNLTILVENTIQSIILVYYNVLLEQEKLSVLEEVKTLSKDRYNYIMEKKKLGGAVTYEVLQAKNSYLTDSSNYLLQKLNLRNALLNMHLLLAEDPEIDYVLTDELEVVQNEYLLKNLKDKMLSNNKTLRNQYVNLEILKKDISLQKSNLFPSIVFSAGSDHYNNRMQYSGMDASYTNNFDFYANFTLSFTLFDGGNIKSAIQNAKINEKIGQLSLIEMEQSMSNQLVNFHELYNIRKQLYEVSELNLESAKLNLQISHEKFKSGAINSFNYRDVQLIYLNASVNKLEAVYNLMDIHTELLRITGGLIKEY